LKLLRKGENAVGNQIVNIEKKILFSEFKQLFSSFTSILMKTQEKFGSQSKTNLIFVKNNIDDSLIQQKFESFFF
jgi:hypothetical protein